MATPWTLVGRDKEGAGIITTLMLGIGLTDIIIIYHSRSSIQIAQKEARMDDNYNLDQWYLIHDGGPVEATTTNDIITLQYYGHVGTRRPLKEICLRPLQPRATAAAW